MHDAIQQALKDEAANIAQDAYARQPYVTEEDCDRYMRVPAQTIPMRKNTNGVWEAKRAKKTD